MTWRFDDGEWIYTQQWACYADDGDAGGDGQGDAAGSGGGGDAAAGESEAGKNEGGNAGGDGLLAAADADTGQTEEVTTDPDTGRPSNIPEQFWNKDEKAVNTDALLKSWKDTKTAHDALVNKQKDVKPEDAAKVPDKPEGYLTDKIVKDGVIPAPEGSKNIGPIAADDEGLQAFLQSAHKHGLTEDAVAGIIADMALVADPMVQPAFDEKAELAKLGDQGPQIAGSVKAWVNGLRDQGIMPQDMYDTTMRFGKTADGVQVLNFIRQLSGEMNNIPVFDTVQGEGGGMTVQEFYAMEPPDPDKDPKAYREWEEASERLFGTGNTGRLPVGAGQPPSHGVTAPPQQQQSKPRLTRQRT